jgi:hypothetical protein
VFDRFGRLLLCVVPTTINAEPSVEFYPLSLGILKIPRVTSRPISKQEHPQNRFQCPFPTPFYIIVHNSLQKLVTVRAIWAVPLVRGNCNDKPGAERGVDGRNPPVIIQTATEGKPSTCGKTATLLNDAADRIFEQRKPKPSPPWLTIKDFPCLRCGTFNAPHILSPSSRTHPHNFRTDDSKNRT